MQTIDEIWTKKQFRRFGHFSPILAIFTNFRGRISFFFWRFSHFEFLFNVSEITKGCFLPWCLGNDPILEDLNDFSKFCGLLKKKIFVPAKIPEKWRSDARKMPVSRSKIFFSTKNWVIPSVIYIGTMPEEIS